VFGKISQSAEGKIFLTSLSRLALKIVVMTREQGTGNREQGRGFGQLYFSLLMSVFFRSLTYLMELFPISKNKKSVPPER
jgi:hypothetical protein